MDWYAVGQAKKMEKYVLVVCHKHDLTRTDCGLKAARWSFPGVAKCVCEFLFTLDGEWKEETLWTTDHFSSAFQSNSAKHARQPPNTELSFSTGSCSVLHLGTLLIPSLTARSSRNFSLFAFQFSGLHKHIMSYLFNRCEELQNYCGVNVHTVQRREKNTSTPSTQTGLHYHGNNIICQICLTVCSADLFQTHSYDGIRTQCGSQLHVLKCESLLLPAERDSVCEITGRIEQDYVLALQLLRNMKCLEQYLQ